MPLRRGRDAHEYSAEEFDLIATTLKHNQRTREDIETITGVSLRNKTPRELFDLWRRVQTLTEVTLDVAKLGAANLALAEQARAVREQASQDVALAEQEKEISRLKLDVQTLQRNLDEERKERRALTAAPAAVVNAEGTGR